MSTNNKQLVLYLARICSDSRQSSWNKSEVFAFLARKRRRSRWPGSDGVQLSFGASTHMLPVKSNEKRCSHMFNFTVVWRELWFGASFDLARALIWRELWSGASFDLARALIWRELWFGASFDLARALIWLECANTTSMSSILCVYVLVFSLHAGGSIDRYVCVSVKIC